MPRFTMRNLSVETRNMHKHQNAWRKRNWQKTLATHGNQIEELLNRLSTLDIWHNKLQSKIVAKELIPEIWMDDYVSIAFSSMGLYKYANMSLRSSLETALRLVYFSTHQVEFGWWKKGSKWYQNYGWGDVWGKAYEYFKGLELFRKFDRECSSDNKAIFGDHGKCLKNLYKSLSGSIHTRAGRFQTSPSRFSPNYVKGKYDRWSKYFIKTLTYVNILFVLGFPKAFEDMPTPDKTKILNVAIGDDYKAEIQRAINQ